MNLVRRFFNTNLREKIMALIVTLIVWGVVVSKMDETRSFAVKLNFYAGKDRVVSLSEPIETIHVTAKGSLFDFARVKDSDLVLSIDLSRKDQGRIAYFFDPSRLPFSRYLSVEQIIPAEITATVSMRAEKQVAVEPYIDGSPAKGWRLESVKKTPGTVRISGPEELLREIDSVTTEKINLSNAKKSFSKRVRIIPSAHSIQIISEENEASVSIAIGRDMREVELKHVPVVLDSEEKAVVSPAFVRLRLKGPAEQIEKTIENGFKVYIADKEQNEFTADRYYVKNLPEGVELIEVEKVKLLTVQKRP